jgi:hypothetical protein
MATIIEITHNPLLLDGPGLLFACMMSSVLSLGMIAGERYIAVFHSYRYPFWITTQRLVAAIINHNLSLK